MKQKFTVYFILLILLAILSFLVILKSQLPFTQPSTKLIIGIEAFFILTILVQIFSIPLFSSQSTTISVVPPVLWAMIVLFGPFYTAIIAVFTTFIYDFQVKKLKYKLIIANVAQQFITVSIAGMTFIWTGGTVGQQVLTSFITPFLASVLVYFILESLLSSCLIAFTENINPVDAWIVNYQWMVPYEFALIPFGILMIFIYQQLSLVGLMLFLIPLLMIRRSYSLNIDLKRTYKETVQAFIRTIEAHDSYTSGHSIRVAKYSKLLAKQLKMPYHDIERLEIAAYLHDIGKITNYFSTKILNHDNTENEDKKDVHLYESDRLISSISFLKEVGDIVRYHNEKWDGTGYPEGLSGEQIPRSARILMIADAFDAMTTDRSYRRAMPINKAVTELQLGAGTQFDPKLVSIFIKDCLNYDEHKLDNANGNIQKIKNRSKLELTEIAK